MRARSTRSSSCRAELSPTPRCGPSATSSPRSSAASAASGRLAALSVTPRSRHNGSAEHYCDEPIHGGRQPTPLRLLHGRSGSLADRRVGVSRLARICHRHGHIVRGGEQCLQCKREHAERGKPRRQANKVRLGRASAQWKRVSREARRLHPYCAKCGALDDLTVHLPRGGNHRTAELCEVQVLCRRCHGRMTGAGSQRPGSC